MVENHQSPLPSRSLLEGVLALVDIHQAPDLHKFKNQLMNWGTETRAVKPKGLPVTKTLNLICDNPINAHRTSHKSSSQSSFQASPRASPRPSAKTTPVASAIRTLLASFNAQRDALFWEQTYNKNDLGMNNDMLMGYGFTEVIGKNGPFVSEKVRCGLGIWNPNLHYPRHRHQAEEVYLVMAGSAEFKLSNQPRFTACTGDVVFVKSMEDHEFTTHNECLIVLYLWQNGDLREKSTFSPPMG